MQIQIDLPEQTVAQVVKRHLAAQPKSPDRSILVLPDDRRAIEAVFQTTVADGADLARRVAALASVQIGGVSVEFSTEELARIDMQAQFHGRTREVFVREMITEIKWSMLEKI